MYSNVIDECCHENLWYDELRDTVYILSTPAPVVLLVTWKACYTLGREFESR